MFIRKILQQNFNRMLKDVKQLSKQTDIMYIDGKYNGYLHCGAMSLCTYMVLKEHNIEPNVYKTSRGNYKNREDHIHLRIGDIIIDPTYKQFLRINGNIVFNTILHDYYDPIFIGSEEELFNRYNNLICINNYISDYKLDIKDFDIFWNKNEDVTEYYNLELLNKFKFNHFNL